MKRRDRTLVTLLAALVVLLAAAPFLPRVGALPGHHRRSPRGWWCWGCCCSCAPGWSRSGRGSTSPSARTRPGWPRPVFGVSDALAHAARWQPAAAVLVAAVLGLLLARYRSIFFAMLSLAFSMILYGLLVKTSALGVHRRLQRRAAAPSARRSSRPDRTDRLAAVRAGRRWSPSPPRRCSTATSARTWAGSPRRSATTSFASSTWARRCATCVHLNLVIAAALAGAGRGADRA